MIPYERMIYMDLLTEWIKQENARIEKENAKMRRS